MSLTLEQILQSLPHISGKRNYWFFRTQGGDYFEDFVKANYIAIGYNKITLEDIKSGNTEDLSGREILSSRINKKYGDEENRPSYVATQLLKFAYEIKKGDIVMIPSASSHNITFGQVTETAAFSANTTATSDCPYLKRKNVKWIKTIPRDSLDPNLYKLMFSHHTITEANAYASYIDKITNSFFIKNEKAHLVLKVEATSDIKAKDLFEMGTIALDLLDDFSKEEQLSYNSDDFNVKINLQSPGDIELAGKVIGGVIILGIILVSIAGGGFTFKNEKGVDVSIKSDGIIEKIKSFLASRSNIKTKKALLEKHMKHLQIKDPEDLVKVLRELDKK